MGSSRSRKLFRLSSGVNRKLTTTRWIGGLTGRVNFPREKASVKAERSVRSTRKTRRGQRGGRKSASAVCHAAPSSPRPSSRKTQSVRVLNHSGRKFWWAERAANRLAARKPVLQLIKEMPWDFGHMSKGQARGLSQALDIGSARWVQYTRWWHLLSYRCRFVGVPSPSSDPLHFLALRSPRAGGADLEELLLFSGLRPDPPPDPFLRRRFCSTCGCEFSGYAYSHWHCRRCEYVGDSNAHSEEICWQIQCLKSALVQGATSKRRRRGRGH